MAIKYEDLVEFVRELQAKHYITIGDIQLRKEIGLKWGISEYVERERITALVKYNLIQPIGEKWRLYTPEQLNHIRKQEILQNEKEIDKYEPEK